MSSDTWFISDYLPIKKLHEYLQEEKIIIDESYQRSSIWKNRQKIELISSIMSSFPIGTLVTIEKGSKIHLIDGQQRIVAISDFLNDELPTINKKLFSQLTSSQKNSFLQYRIPIISLNSKLSLDQTSLIFVRLQEGSPLSTAEKVYAFTGNFRNVLLFRFGPWPGNFCTPWAWPKNLKK